MTINPDNHIEHIKTVAGMLASRLNDEELVQVIEILEFAPRRMWIALCNISIDRILKPPEAKR